MLALEHTSNFISYQQNHLKKNYILFWKKKGLDQFSFQCVLEQKQRTKSHINKYTDSGDKEKPSNVLGENLPFEKGPSQALKNQTQLAEGIFTCVLNSQKLILFWKNFIAK